MVRSFFVAIAFILFAISTPTSAAEIKVLTAGAYKSVLMDLLPAFEKATGHTVKVDNDTAGALVKRSTGGESFDVVVLTPGALAEPAMKEKVAADKPVALARVGVGVAVKDGAPKPDISTTESFKAALTKARAVAMIDPAAGGSSGIYLMKLFEQWGIADAIKAKAVLVPGGIVATRLVTGEADIAIHQISEILIVKGAMLVGPLPADIQNYTNYAGAVSANSTQAEAAKLLLKALSSEDAVKVIKDKGMTPPGV
jgi:molybdate transport system substrate-binding protein